jgi:hypothetical protein
MIADVSMYMKTDTIDRANNPWMRKIKGKVNKEEG